MYKTDMKNKEKGPKRMMFFTSSQRKYEKDEARKNLVDL